MPANPTSILLNSVSSVSNVNRGSARETSSESFADQWSQQSSAARRPNGREGAEPRGQVGQPERRENQAEHSVARSRSNQVDNGSSGKAASQANQLRDNRAEKTTSSDEFSSRSNTKVTADETPSNKARNESKTDSVISSADLKEPAKELSSEERFILALLGVSVEPAENLPAINSDSAVAQAQTDAPREFIDLFLIGGSAFAADPANELALAGSNTHTLEGELAEDDASFILSADLSAELVGTSEAATAANAVIADLGNTELKASALTAEAKPVVGQKATMVGLNEQGGGIELPEADAEPEAGDMLETTAKTKNTVGQLSTLMKDPTGLGLAKDAAPSASAAGYSETVGISQGQSLGRATGLEHNFQLQRDANVQGRTTMQSDIGQAQWKTEIAEKVAWFSARNISHAEIRLDPPELGSLQIKIQLNQEQAQVTFNSPHASVREALDQSSNRLREMFQEQGLNLADVNVGGEGAQERESAAGELAEASPGDDHLDAEAELPIAHQRIGLVDSYA